jgi:hypothetical protein
MRLGANKHPIDRFGLRRIAQHMKRRFDRTFRPLQCKSRDRLAHTGYDIVLPGGCETAGGAATDAAKPDHRDTQPPRLCPRRHGCSTRSGENR